MSASIAERRALAAVLYGYMAPLHPDMSRFGEQVKLAPRTGMTPAGSLWLCLHGDLLRSCLGSYPSIQVSEELAAYIRERSIYGHADLNDFNQAHYLELIGQGETVLVVLKFQRIIGQHILARVPREAVISLLNSGVPV